MRQYYTLDMLENLYRFEEPNLSEKAVEEKAKSLKRVLNTMDIYWTRSNRRFYSHNQLQNFLPNFN
ncbi:MAG: hypothetical protein H6Q73_3361 [Firmicutes bacterium]|nr:hypothetical protein [Bacillota bacterium]